MRVWIALALIFSGALAGAHEHGKLGTIQGEHLSLFYTDHAISGHVRGRLVYASPLEEEYGLRLRYRWEGADHESVFKKDGNDFRGNLLAITRANAKEGTIEGTLGKDAFIARITSDKMAGHHYVDPRFDVKEGERSYTFKLVNGEACMGCALKIVYAVLGMVRATGGI